MRRELGIRKNEIFCVSLLRKAKKKNTTKILVKQMLLIIRIFGKE